MQNLLSQEASAKVEAAGFHELWSLEEDFLVGWVFAARSAVPVGIAAIHHWDGILPQWIAWRKCVGLSGLDVLNEDLSTIPHWRFFLRVRRI